MSENGFDQRIRVNEAVLSSSRQIPADANSSDALLFRNYLTGGQQAGNLDQNDSFATAEPVKPDNETVATNPGTTTPSTPESRFLEDTLNLSIPKYETYIGYWIASGQSEFSTSVSAADRSNAFMFSDTIRYNFETETLQVFADSNEGDVGWQNISDVNSELAADVRLTIETLKADRPVLVSTSAPLPPPGSTPESRFLETTLNLSIPKYETYIGYWIASGEPEFPTSVSAEDRYNAFMFSDTIRYNFETETVQVLADSNEGDVGWQNISDVNSELAADVRLTIETLKAPPPVLVSTSAPLPSPGSTPYSKLLETTLNISIPKHETYIGYWIASGEPEFPNSVSANDRNNAFMFSDTIRYNFETETVQVLAESHVGGLGWQNISDVSPELAADVRLDIETLKIHRQETRNLIETNFPSHDTDSAADIFANTQVSVGAKQPGSNGTASVTVNTQAQVGPGVDSQDGSAQSEPELQPNTILSFGNGNNVSSTYFTDGEGNLMTADINLKTGNATISDEAGNIVMAGTVNTVTGETNFRDANGEIIPAEDSLIGTEKRPPLQDEAGYPNTVLAISVIGETVNFVLTPGDGGVGPTYYDQNGEQVPAPPLPTMLDGITPRPGGTPLLPETQFPEGAIAVSTDGSNSGGLPVRAVTNTENQSIESFGVDANGNEITVVSHPSSGVSMVIDANTGATLAYIQVNPVSGALQAIDSNGQPLNGSPYLETYRPNADIAVAIDGHPATAVRVKLADGTLLYQAYIIDDIGENPLLYVTGPDGKPLLSGVQAPFADYVPVLPDTEQAPLPDDSQDNQQTDGSGGTPPPLNLTTDAAFENQQEELPVDFSTDAAWEPVNQQTEQDTQETTQTQNGGSGGSSGTSGTSGTSGGSGGSGGGLGKGVSPSNAKGTPF